MYIDHRTHSSTACLNVDSFTSDTIVNVNPMDGLVCMVYDGEGCTGHEFTTDPDSEIPSTSPLYKLSVSLTTPAAKAYYNLPGDLPGLAAIKSVSCFPSNF